MKENMEVPDISCLNHPAKVTLWPQKEGYVSVHTPKQQPKPSHQLQLELDPLQKFYPLEADVATDERPRRCILQRVSSLILVFVSTLRLLDSWRPYSSLVSFCCRLLIRELAS